MSRDLTDRQEQVLAKIVEMTRKRGFPPTNRELRVALGIKSSNGVADHLRALEKKGRIRVSFGLARGIEVIGQPAASDAVPVMLRPAVAASMALVLREALDTVPAGLQRTLAFEGLSLLDAALGAT